MKARLYRSRSLHDDFGRSYLVVCRCKVVGEIMRYRRRVLWTAFADKPTVTNSMPGFVRRGDAKRWVVKNQGMVAS